MGLRCETTRQDEARIRFGVGVLQQQSALDPLPVEPGRRPARDTGTRSSRMFGFFAKKDEGLLGEVVGGDDLDEVLQHERGERAVDRGRGSR